MAGVIDTSEFRKGMKIEIDGEPFEIIEFQHVKPGKGSAFTRTTIRSLISGRNLEPTFKSGDKVDRPDIEEREMQYLYREGNAFVFMSSNVIAGDPQTRRTIVHILSNGDRLESSTDRCLGLASPDAAMRLVFTRITTGEGSRS